MSLGNVLGSSHSPLGTHKRPTAFHADSRRGSLCEASRIDAPLPHHDQRRTFRCTSMAAQFVLGAATGAAVTRYGPRLLGAVNGLRKHRRNSARPMATMTEAGQEHLAQALESLSGAERDAFLKDINSIDLAYVNEIFKASMAAAEEPKGEISPYKDVTQLKDITSETREEWTALGYKLIAQGKVGILLLAGGQGTRLGSKEPKGCYNVGLPSGKSLFHIQAERILKLQRLAAKSAHGDESDVQKPLRWYIMTSPFTDEATKKHFEQNAYFGLESSQVFFFQQGSLPCLTSDGKVIMETPSKIARGPDGNGGVYMALDKSGCLADMRKHGVECLDCFCVDNLLAKMGDPLFVGYNSAKGAECGARVVAKAYPEEKVGVFATRSGNLEVVEYSELDASIATSKDTETGQLNYNWGNICMHYFTVDFLERVKNELRKAAKYHIANKKIPSKDGPVQGMKLELFIFDAFPLAKSVALMEADRNEQFAPVKNAPGSPSDSPDTARALLMSLHKRWIEQQGGKVDVDGGVEVSPLVSYGGEGLENCKEVVLTSVDDARLQGSK